MRLFHYPSNKCQHITELMPSISTVYEFEQIFFPYLSVEFLPVNKSEKTGVILLTKDGRQIKRDYSFHDKKEKQEMLNILWDELNKERQVGDIADKKGCIKDFRKYNNNRVIQGWQAKKRIAKSEQCCKIIISKVTDSYLNWRILHERYRLSTKDEQTKEICKKVRFEECGNNYPPNTPTFHRCVDEVDWLCENAYPINKVKSIKDKYIAKVQKDLYDDLLKNDMKVDKKKFDAIITAGLFDDVANRMGNKSSDWNDTRNIVHEIFKQKGYYRDLIENFDDSIENEMVMPEKNKSTVLGGLGFIGVIVLIVIIWLFMMKNKQI